MSSKIASKAFEIFVFVLFYFSWCLQQLLDLMLDAIARILCFPERANTNFFFSKEKQKHGDMLGLPLKKRKRKKREELCYD